MTFPRVWTIPPERSSTVREVRATEDDGNYRNVTFTFEDQLAGITGRPFGNDTKRR